MTISDKYDVQTGYLKKEAFEEFADMAEREDKFKSVPVGVLFTDINDLKKYHDYYGHAMSDLQIRKVALVIEEATKCRGEYYRFGGDEFVVLAKNYDRERANAYINNVRAYIETKIRTENKRYDVVISAGVHIADPSSEDREERFDQYHLFSKYLKLADSAMYEEKRQHKQYKI